ncbi:PLP-dependent aminotransferase family protein [Bacillus sp. JJ722]|uniref:MocR-like pyridoxine biosynthesis transcription factor PdxR n=1 Tax=Bacillus sp. JJ722 TaxID=3122973 RepID=UPI002FFF9326
MEIQITFSGKKSKYIEIYEQLQQMILQQVLKAHVKMPSKRQLAKQLNISIYTIQESYEQLLSEGFLYSEERRGYFVAEIEDNLNYKLQPLIKDCLPVKKESFINFQNGQIDAKMFPYKLWNRLYKKHLSETHISNASWYGEDALRIQIAEYLQQARGFQCQTSQIFIFSGTQQQLSLLCQFFKQPKVGIEEPGFMRALSVFKQLHLDTAHVFLDSEGCTVPKQKVKLLYTTPAHQYPTGKIMSINRRIQLLNWAKQANAYILEDDYDSEFRYKGSPIPSLAQLDQLKHVIYFGSFSKTLMPSIRLSYIVLPLALVESFQQFNLHQKSTVSRIDQLIIADLMQQGNYVKHIAKMRTLYRAKRKCLIEAIEHFLGNEFEIIGDDAGLHMIVQLPLWLTEQMAINRAKSVGIAVDAVSTMYHFNKPNHQIMIGYGAPTIEEIRHGIQEIATVWKKD